MTSFRIFETDEFTRCMKRLDSTTRNRLEATLKARVYPQLRKQPYFGGNIKRLRGYDPVTWRYRLGDYRLFYVVSEETKVVSIVSLENRKDAYR
ncbi:MAG: type II toxin-antitoxin system RelE/ParE family toxin [Candidatus Hydrogenedentes bacterium]|nr:type II toxin-antitoxin system RelE/ParE family toxin [Candidatus Hydrogenedentota bacterium]